MILTDTGENEPKCAVDFRLGAESYSSLGPVGKKEKKIACPLLDVFACGQVSSPRLYRLIIGVKMKFDDNMEKYAVDVELKFPLKSILT